MPVMASDTLPCDSVEIHDTETAENLVLESEDASLAVQYSPPPRRTASVMSAGPVTAVDTSALIGHSMKLQDWLCEKTVRNIQRKFDAEAQRTSTLYEPVLAEEASFVRGLSDYVSASRDNDQRRRALLYKRWSEQVYEPLRREIERETQSADLTRLSLKKRELYKDYLEHVNRKGTVFLDTSLNDEYYPMVLHPTRPSFLSARTPRLKDPLLTQERSRSAEDRLIFRCLTGSVLTDRDMEQVRLPPRRLVPLSRHGNDSRTWLEVAKVDIESPVRQASRRRMRPSYTHTQIRFDGWGGEAVTSHGGGADAGVTSHRSCAPAVKQSCAVRGERPPSSRTVNTAATSSQTEDGLHLAVM